jgi:hypothetical protein
MAALSPIFTVILQLEGFEATAFWVTVVVVFMLSGFLIDMLMLGQGFGPFVNGLFVLAGTFAGLYVRFNYAAHFRAHIIEPFLSVGLILGSITVLLVSAGYVRNRTN